MNYLQHISSLEVFNSMLAILGALAAFGSVNVMRDVVSHADLLKTIVATRQQGEDWWHALMAGFRSAETMGVACGFVTLAAGLIGQAVGQLAGAWQGGFDTLMFGGVLAFLLSNRRSLVFIGDYKHVASLSVTAVCWIMFFAKSH